MQNGTRQHSDAIVIGGGLAGLTAAAYLARAGRSVTVLERSKTPGGRAITNRFGEFDFNLGAHALYRSGPGKKVLDELGIAYTGKAPPLNGTGILEGKLHRLAATPWWMLRTPLLRGAAKWQLLRFYSSLPTLDPQKLRHISTSAWLDKKARHPDARRLTDTLVRVATYSNDPAQLSAQVAVTQLKLAMRGVLYLDHGWQTLVDGLRSAAESAGARIVTGARAVAIERDGAVRGVRLDGGETLAADAVIVATTPDAAAALVDDASIAEHPPAARAATLEIGLRALPNPDVAFALGLDAPTYLSVHSLTAKLAPEGGAMIHLARYLPPDDAQGPTETERELEGVLDLTQPGWRDVLDQRRFLPSMDTTSVLATAERGGFEGRTPVEVAETAGLFLAGDWVGPRGWLSDGSFCSGKSAAELALRSLAQRGARAEPAGAMAV